MSLVSPLSFAGFECACRPRLNCRRQADLHPYSFIQATNQPPGQLMHLSLGNLNGGSCFAKALPQKLAAILSSNSMPSASISYSCGNVFYVSARVGQGLSWWRVCPAFEAICARFCWGVPWQMYAKVLQICTKCQGSPVVACGCAR